MSGWRRIRLLLISAWLTLACGSVGLFDMQRLEQNYPALRDDDGVRGHRLADLVPYLLPTDGELLGFVCRWNRDPIRVGFDAGMNTTEHQLVQHALRLWAGVLPEVSFEPTTEASEAEIVVRVGAVAPGRSGITSAECAVAPPATSDAGRLDAALVESVVILARRDIDKLGRSVPLSETEFLATAVHELGHALGFQGHLAATRSVMRREVSAVRGLGERLRRGQLEEPTLRALYSVPSGTIVWRAPLVSASARRFERLMQVARERGVSGPFVRVGDRAGRVSWWPKEGARVGVDLGRVRSAFEEPAQLEFEFDATAREWLRDASSGTQR